ncbi:PQQ-binding-like beta-propeller repeat protein [Halomontanus rarus]|uniref:outer membrane protein assembly factor BamB family protein n=1 Tax=Halomontanus rarus TaxID=3034020 RepID=UPI0023E7D32A|nr:PQQ-binding-like beta-propeller repeat protein [Halovivax sp. TS33]
MHRRGVLATLGVTLSGGCLESFQSRSESPPDEFDRSAYADGFTSHGPWEVDRCDSAGTGHNPTSRLPTGDVDAAWLRTVDGTIDPRTVPVTDDRLVYVGHQQSTDAGQRGAVTALEGRTGTREWTTVLKLPTSGDAGADDAGTQTRTRNWDTVGGLARDGETVYVTGHSRRFEVVLLAALDAASGAIDWQVSVPGTEYCPPVVDANGVYLPSGRAVSSEIESGGKGGGEPTVNALYAFSHGGTERWTHRFENRKKKGKGKGMGNAIPTRNTCVADGIVYTSLTDGRIVALETDDGTPRWERTVLERTESIRDERNGHIAVDGDDDRLYASADGRLSAHSREDGSPLWTLDVAGGGATRRPLTTLVCREGTIHVGCANTLVAVDPTDGTERWRLEDAAVGESLAGTGDGLVSASVSASDSGSGTTVAGIDLVGETQWSVDPRGDSGAEATDDVNPRVISAHDVVYLAFADGRVYAIGARGD